MLTPVLKDSKESNAYLTSICTAKLFDKKTSLEEAADRIELANIVLDVVPELDSSRITQEKRQFIDQLMNALYYGQMLPHTSLFFFRCSQLERVLDAMARHPKYGKERDFWIKSEDMIIRQRDQFDVNKLCRIAHIYSKVNPSQLFWVEIESILLSKSTEFAQTKESATSLYLISNALA